MTFNFYSALLLCLLFSCTSPQISLPKGYEYCHGYDEKKINEHRELLSLKPELEKAFPKKVVGAAELAESNIWFVEMSIGTRGQGQDTYYSFSDKKSYVYTHKDTPGGCPIEDYPVSSVVFDEKDLELLISDLVTKFSRKKKIGDLCRYRVVFSDKTEAIVSCS